MKRLLQYTSQKITTHPQRSLVRFFSSHFMQNDYFSIVVSAHILVVKQKTTTRYFAPRLTLSHSPTLILLLLSTYFLRASCYACSYLVSRSPLLVSASASRHERFSHAYASLACMYTLHACSASCFHYRTCFPTVHVHFSSRASWLHALTSYHTLHHCSVPVQRTSRQSSLCRCLATSAQHPLPVMLAMHMLYKLSYRNTRVNLRRTPES